MTRGRHANHAHVAPDPVDDDHHLGPPPEALTHETARRVLAGCLARVGGQQAAHTLLEETRRTRAARSVSCPASPVRNRPEPEHPQRTSNSKHSGPTRTGPATGRTSPATSCSYADACVSPNSNYATSPGCAAAAAAPNSPLRSTPTAVSSTPRSVASTTSTTSYPPSREPSRGCRQKPRKNGHTPEGRTRLRWNGCHNRSRAVLHRPESRRTDAGHDLCRRRTSVATASNSESSLWQTENAIA